MYSTQELIANKTIESFFSENEIIQMRESFVNKYCSFKNWDKYNLTIEQVSEIRTKSEWKNPGLVTG